MKKLRGVWKHPKTRIWIARFRNAVGRWVNRSTGTTDGREAERIATQWKIEAERERDQQVGSVSPAGISDTITRAERLARSGRLDVHAARDLINELLVAAGQDSVETVTNRAWCEVGSSRVDLQACKLEYSIVSPK